MVFWGGAQNGFWGFANRPQVAAASVHMPTLLLQGALDPRVTRREIDDIYTNLQGKKRLKIYPNTYHENYLIKNHDAWVADVSGFLSEATLQ